MTGDFGIFECCLGDGVDIAQLKKDVEDANRVYAHCSTCSQAQGRHSALACLWHDFVT